MHHLPNDKSWRERERGKDEKQVLNDSQFLGPEMHLLFLFHFPTDEKWLSSCTFFAHLYQVWWWLSILLFKKRGLGNFGEPGPLPDTGHEVIKTRSFPQEFTIRVAGRKGQKTRVDCFDEMWQVPQGSCNWEDRGRWDECNPSGENSGQVHRSKWKRGETVSEKVQPK